MAIIRPGPSSRSTLAPQRPRSNGRSTALAGAGDVSRYVERRRRRTAQTRRSKLRLSADRGDAGATKSAAPGVSISASVESSPSSAESETALRDRGFSIPSYLERNLVGLHPPCNVDASMTTSLAYQPSSSRRKCAPCRANSSCDGASGRQIDAALAISTAPGVKDSMTAAPSYSTSRSASRIPFQSW